MPNAEYATGSRPMYTPEQRRRRDASPWTIVQGVLAPLQLLAFLVSLWLVLQFLQTGAGGTAGSWDRYQIPFFKDRFRNTTFDGRGAGTTTTDDPFPWTIEDFARDTAEKVLSTLQIRSQIKDSSTRREEVTTNSAPRRSTCSTGSSNASSAPLRSSRRRSACCTSSA